MAAEEHVKLLGGALPPLLEGEQRHPDFATARAGIAGLHRLGAKDQLRVGAVPLFLLPLLQQPVLEPEAGLQRPRQRLGHAAAHDPRVVLDGDDQRADRHDRLTACCQRQTCAGWRRPPPRFGT